MAEPRAVIEQLVSCINARDEQQAKALFAPDCRVVMASGAEIDVDGYSHSLKRVIEAFPDMTFSVERWVCEGDNVCTEEVLEGTHVGTFGGIEATGRKIRLPMLHLSRIEDGRIVERISYHDTAGILRRLTQ